MACHERWLEDPPLLQLSDPIMCALPSALPFPATPAHTPLPQTGGDYGKKELSPALSNRFTSIWVPAIEDNQELLAILESRLAGV